MTLAAPPEPNMISLLFAAALCASIANSANTTIQPSCGYDDTFEHRCFNAVPITFLAVPVEVRPGVRAYDGIPACATYAWDFGDGGRSTDPAPRHVYETAGERVVVVRVKVPGARDDAVVVILVRAERGLR
jgi:hypothetical protein